MNCEETKALIGPARDNELTSSETAKVMSHLSECNDCQGDWDKVIAVKEGIQKLLDRQGVPVDLEKKISNALYEESRKDRQSRTRTIVLAAAAAVTLGLGAFMVMQQPSGQIAKAPEQKIPGQQTQTAPQIASLPEAAASVEHILNTAGHHGETSDDANISIDYVGKQDSEDLSKSSGLSVKPSTLANYKLYGSDVIKVGKDKTMVRLCYVSNNGKGESCIDCYQAPSGMLSLGPSEIQTLRGKTVRMSKVGSDNVVVISNNGMDIFYVSPMKEQDLIKLVEPNV